MQKKKTSNLRPFSGGLNPVERELLDEYHRNGNNGAEAVKTVLPNHNQAIVARSQKMARVLKKTEAQAYLHTKEVKMAVLSDVTASEVIAMLQKRIAPDPTVYAGLTVKQLQALPTELKEPIKSINYTTKETTNKKGEQYNEVTCSVTLYDQIELIKEINKMKGHYKEHNKQKATNVNTLIQSFVRESPDGAFELLKMLEFKSEAPQE